MTPEALLTLLRSHQDGVYTVCLHVLRNPHDAEDAAQEALLKIASGAKDLREPRAFKSWLYRLVFRTAVDHARQRATRRRIEEGSVPMSPAPLSDEQRDAIHEAMAALPDDERLMLVEHYFEKVTIEELGRREGISDVAMGKRIEKARERLKRGLAGAGIQVGASQVAHAFESVTPASAPAGLIGPAIASKAALAAGGAAVGSKGMAILAVVALVLLLGVGAGVLWFYGIPSMGTGETSASSDTVHVPGDRTVALGTTRSIAPRAGPDLRMCRDLVAGLVTRLRSNDVARIAWEIHAAQAGGMPVMEEFVREFMKAAGDQIIPFSRKLLAESESDAVRLLVTVVLGRSADPAGLELLKGLCADDSSVPIRASALYSVGLLKTPEGFALLQSAWERANKEGGPLGQTLVMAIGLQGADALDWLLSELRTSDLKKLLNHQGVPWSFSLQKEDCLSFVRGKEAFSALRRIHESDPDPKLRFGAARGLLANFDSSQLDYMADMVTGTEDVHEKSTLLYSVRLGEKSPARTELVDRVITRIPYPSGDVELDRSLVRLAQIASPAQAASLFDRFMAVASSSKDEQLMWNMGAMFMAAAGVPDADARIAALMKAVSLSPKQRGIVLATGLYGATPETAAALSKPVLELIRSSAPASDIFANCLQPLLRCGLEERVLSDVLQELSDRQSDPTARLRVLQEVMVFTGGPVLMTRQITIPRTYLTAAAERASDPESLLCAVHALASSGPEALDPWRTRVAEWIGRDMKWIDHAKQDNYLSWVAPGVIGDYYARFGTAADATWLKDLPEGLSYPASWSEGERSRLKSVLREESRRAMDAIRLRQ